MTTNPNTTLLWELPEGILYSIACFASEETRRVSFLCHKVAFLCRASHTSIRGNRLLWEAVLQGDYGVIQTPKTSRRSCKRLCKSPFEQVREAHRLMKDHTEIAFYYVSELCSSQTLQRSKLVAILQEYGPVSINQVVSSGGTFLVEICRAKKATSQAILLCVKELVERNGARVSVSTYESQTAHLTPLCVAAVRGMHQVVRYLLSQPQSASLTKTRCSGRFRLHSNRRKTIKCTNATPLEFARSMREAEASEGAANLTDLDKVIRLLERVPTPGMV